jgi:hypothetical protein
MFNHSIVIIALMGAVVLLAGLVILSECGRIRTRERNKVLERESFRYHAKGRERSSKGQFINDDDVDTLEQ